MSPCCLGGCSPVNTALNEENFGGKLDFGILVHSDALNTNLKRTPLSTASFPCYFTSCPPNWFLAHICPHVDPTAKIESKKVDLRQISYKMSLQ